MTVEELKLRKQWVSHSAKQPFTPGTLTRAKTNDPQTWGSFDTALKDAVSGKRDGVGFVFSPNDNIMGVDFDHCIHEGVLAPWVQDWVDRFDSYTEVSYSGTGVHILCLGYVPGGSGKHWPEAEMYDRGRYFTVTEAIYGDKKPLREAQDAINALYAELSAKHQRPTAPAETHTVGGNAPDPLDDLALLDRGYRMEKLPNLKRLMEGDYSSYTSQSEADIALCNMLAFLTRRDAARVDRIFRTSGLMRPKWDEHRQGGTYGSITVAKACSTAQKVYDPEEYKAEQAKRELAKQQEERPRLVSASEIEYVPPKWTLAPYFQRGKGTLIQADSGVGKTAFVCAIAALISTGRPLINLPVATPGNVIIVSVEDDLPVLRGRIEASGGDVNKCYLVTNAGGMSVLDEEVETMIKQVNARMIIFDPLQAFMGAKVDMFRANETRPVFAKLFDMCERNDCCCVIIAHTGKSSGDKSAVNRSLGSVDIPASMRSVLHIVQDPENESQRIAVHVKCSNAPKGQSIVYSIGDRGGVTWVGFRDFNVDDLNAVQTIRKRRDSGLPYDKEPLVRVLRQLVKDKPGGGFWSYADLKAEGARILGFPPFDTTQDLKYKLDTYLSRELQANDKLLVTCGHRTKNARGVRIEQVGSPQEEQLSIPG